MNADREWHPVFAKGRDGKPVHVKDVARGLACNCTCRECNQPVVAHQGPKNAWHFQHYGPTNCSPSPESDLHRFAKDLLAEHLYLWLPEGCAEATGKSEILFKRGRCKFTRAEIELVDGNVTPDLILTKADGKQLRVEIYVRHRCDAAKIAKLKDRNLDTIEIDLSHVQWDDDSADWVESILETAPRKWLHNGRVRDHEQRVETDFLGRKNAIIAAYREAQFHDWVKGVEQQNDYLTVSNIRRWKLVEHEIESEHCFTVESKFWQARLFRHFFLHPRVRLQERFDTKAALAVIQDYVEPGLGMFIGRDLIAAVRLEIPEFQTPWAIVNIYLRWLRDKYFYLDNPSQNTWAASATAIERFNWELRRQDWIVKSTIWLDEVLAKIPDAETSEFDCEGWLWENSFKFEDTNLEWNMVAISAEFIEGKVSAFQWELLDLPLELERER